MKKVLFVANVIDEHIIPFQLPYIKWFKDNGWIVHIATGSTVGTVPGVDNCYRISIKRNPYNIHNIQAIYQLKEIIESEEYSLIHCHTPIASVVCRISAMSARRKGVKVLYTAHGFHFFKGAPLLNWCLYFPVERFLKKYTDGIITINREDFQMSVSCLCYKPCNVFLINGIGVNTDRLRKGIVCDPNRYSLRSANNISQDDFVLLCVARLVNGKNHRRLIRLVARLQLIIPSVKLLIVGDGILSKQLEIYAHKIGIQERVIFTGNRQNIGDYIAMSDIGVSLSEREGLCISVAEMLYCGLPVVATNIRGQRDIVINNYNGVLLDKHGLERQFCKTVSELYDNVNFRNTLAHNAPVSMGNYTVDTVIKQMAAIYERYI